MQESVVIAIEANTRAITAFFGYLIVIILIDLLSARFSSRGISELVPAFAVSFVLTMLVSLLTRGVIPQERRE